MRTYAYKVVVKPDEGGWHAYCPALRAHGAVTQGATEAEAYAAINEVVQMVIDELPVQPEPQRDNKKDTGKPKRLPGPSRSLNLMR